MNLFSNNVNVINYNSYLNNLIMYVLYNLLNWPGLQKWPIMVRKISSNILGFKYWLDTYLYILPSFNNNFKNLENVYISKGHLRKISKKSVSSLCMFMNQMSHYRLIWVRHHGTLLRFIMWINLKQSSQKIWKIKQFIWE